MDFSGEATGGGLQDFITAAYSGDNAAVYIALAIIAMFMFRSLGARATFAYSVTSLCGGLVGASNAPSIRAIIIGFIVGAASTLVVSYGLIWTAVKMKLPTMRTLLQGQNTNGDKHDDELPPPETPPPP